MRISRFGACFLIVMVLVGCTQPSSPPPPNTPLASREPVAAAATSSASPTVAVAAPPTTRQATPIPSLGPSRNLVMGVRDEPLALSDRVLSTAGSESTLRLFNASLSMIDSQGQALPYLAESLPQLNTDSWKLLPDGQMETTYRLRPNLTWHDGRPLTAQDFSFAALVYSTRPIYGYFEPTALERMVAVSSPDPQTLIIRWNSLYPDAGTLRARLFTPLPKHILEPQWFQLFSTPVGVENPGPRFMSHPYWTSEFIGAGPYKLDRWEPGAFLEASAFDQHALGRPRIEKITVRFIPDPNVALASLRADEIHLAVDNALQFEQAQVLKRDWNTQGEGNVLLDLVEPRVAAIQFRPSLSVPQALLDVRVRRALISSLDRQGIVDGLFDGEVPVSDQLVPRSASYYADVERAIRRYTYDVRQAEQLMGEAGYQKGAGSSAFTNTAGERFAFESWTRPGRDGERLGALMAQSWRQAGYDVAERQLTSASLSDGQVLTSFPSLSNLATPPGEMALAALVSEEIPGADTRWQGLNWGGWSNQQYDRLWGQFNTTLDRAERNRQVTQMMQMATEDVALIPLFHNPAVMAFVAGLRGPEIGTPDRLAHWNIHQWELQ